MGNRQKHLFLYPVTIGQYTFLMAGWAEVTCLAAEGEQIIMTAVIAIDAGKSFVQVAAIDNSVEYLFLYPTVNHAGSDQFLIVLSYTLIEWEFLGR